MSEAQAMEIVLETEDYQNFRVRQVPVSSMPYPRLTAGSRVLLTGPGMAGREERPPAGDGPMPAGLVAANT